MAHGDGRPQPPEELTFSPASVREWTEVVKNILLIGMGIFIILHETVHLEGPPRILLLLIAAAALSLPISSYMTRPKD